MAYIGKDLPGILNHNKLFETFTGDGIITSKVLSRTPGSVNNVDVFYDGAFQTPGVDFTLSGNTITFTSAPPNGVVVSILAGEDSQVITPEENTVTSAKITNNTITNALLPSTIPSTKLSGSALPAIDGSNLLNVSTGLLSGSSDPTVTQNPASGLGTVYTNTTDGEVFVLTDDTTDKNVWVNVGGGFGNVHSDSFQGEIAGFSAGGHNNSITITSIDRFSFLSDDNATSHGDLTANRYQCVGASSKSNNYGYAVGGVPNNQTIDKFLFSSISSSKDVGDLQQNKRSPAGISSSTDGYAAGGTVPPESDTVEKFSFSSDANSQNVATLTAGRYGPAGTNDTTHGYCSGGYSDFVPQQNIIDRFSFASGGPASDVGDLTSTGRVDCAGVSSTTYGYTIGGYTPTAPAGPVDIIDRFQFAASSNASDVGDVAAPKAAMTGHSSTTHGYVSGGSTVVNTIQKFSFASGTQDAGDVGDLTVSKFFTAGSQY